MSESSYSNDEIFELEDLPLDEEFIEHESIDKSFLLQSFYAKKWVQNYTESITPTLLLDPKLYILWSNDAFNNIYKDEDITIQNNFLEIFPAQDQEMILGEIYKTLLSAKNGHSWQGKSIIRRKTKRTININIVLIPVFSDEGVEIPLFGTIIQDITEESHQLLKGTFLSLLEASKLKDNDTGNHIQRVNEYSFILSQFLYDSHTFPEIDIDFLEDIAFLAAMHDVGKIGTPDDILNKAGPLEKWEWEIMREHTINGAYILSTYPKPMAKNIALFHHEWWDGTGYPYQLVGPAIPLSARIVAIADVYDALRMKRSYKEALPHSNSIELMYAASGSHFDPLLVEALKEINQEFDAIFSNLSDL